MFPTSIEGAIAIPADGADAALDRLASALAARGAKFIEREPGKLCFNGKTIWAVNWSPLLFFGRCEISVQSQAIQYNCSTKIVLLFVTSLVALFWFSILSANPKIPTPLLFIIPILVWLWLYGGNYLICLVRMRNFLSAAVSGDSQRLSHERTFSPRFW